MKDKPALMSREKIEALRKKSVFIDWTIEECHAVIWTALAAHDIYDKAIEDAAQRVEAEALDSTLDEISDHIRQLKGTSNG